MTFLHLVPLAWATRNSRAGEAGRGVSVSTREFAGRPCYWADQTDTWQGVTHRDNIVKRWAAHLQNDFRARLDWCVRPVPNANHPPRVVVNGSDGKDVIRLSPFAGARLLLSSAGSNDPDGDQLSFEWFIYAEAGTYLQPIRIDDAASAVATIYTPVDAAGKEIHVIVAVTIKASRRSHTIAASSSRLGNQRATSISFAIALAFSRQRG